MARSIKQQLNRLHERIDNFKMKVRKKYIILRYRFNWNTHKVVILKTSDRKFGLTRMLIKDCVDKDCVLYVPTYKDKNRVAREICMYAKLNVIPDLSAEEALRKIICADEIKHKKYNGRRGLKVLVDNQCTIDDVTLLKDSGLNIVNGFVTFRERRK